MPDGLLAEVDGEAERLGSTRSAVLRGFAEAAIRRRRKARAEAIAELLSEATEGHGGDVVARLKASRPR